MTDHVRAFSIPHTATAGPDTDPAYAVAHTPRGAVEQTSAAKHVEASDAQAPGWPRVSFADARDGLARGALLYTVAEVVTLLEARAAALEADLKATERRRATLPVSVTSEAAGAPRAHVEELRRVIDRIRVLADGDVPTARALWHDLTIAAASGAKAHDAAFGRAQASAEGAAIVRRCLIPRCVTWSAAFPLLGEGDLDLLARVMAGVPDVRLGAAGRGAHGAVSETGAEEPLAEPLTAPLPVRPISRDEWKRMLAEDEARRPSWEEPRGVLNHVPAEVADLLEAEARLYEEAAGRLRASRGFDGDGEALGHLAADLRREIPRVRALRSGDVRGARDLLTDLRREQRDHTRARRRALWRRSVTHLDVVVDLVEDLLLPLVVEGPGYVRDRGGAAERAVYRRWEAGVPDVRLVLGARAGTR